MKLDKVEVCMTTVKGIFCALKNVGAVCENCKNLDYLTEKYPGQGYCSTIDKYVMVSEEFCKDFEYRDEAACQKTFAMIMNHVEAADDAERSL